MESIILETRRSSEELAKRVGYDVAKFNKAIRDDVKRIEKEFGIKLRIVTRENL
jgi:hypothetical protein